MYAYPTKASGGESWVRQGRGSSRQRRDRQPNKLRSLRIWNTGALTQADS